MGSASQLFHRSFHQFIEAGKMIGQGTCRTNADMQNAETEKQSPKRLRFTACDRFEQLAHALLAHPLERRELRSAELVNVADVSDEFVIYQLLHHRFAQAVDVHGAARGKM